jgi:hypothetical protein
VSGLLPRILRLRLIACSFSSGTCSRFGCGTLGFFLGAAGLLLGLALRHFLGGSLRGFLLGTHLLFGSTACLLGLALRHLLLLAQLLLLRGTACLFLRLALRHFLRPTFHFGLTTRLFFGFTKGHLLGGSLRGFLLGTHLLFFRGTACRLLLLALHGGLCLLPGTFGFGGSGGRSLLGGHALLFLLLLHRSSLGLFGGGALLSGEGLLLLGSKGLHADFFSFGGGCLLCRHLLGLQALLGLLLLTLLHHGGLGLLFSRQGADLFRLSDRTGHGRLLIRDFFGGRWLWSDHCRRRRCDHGRCHRHGSRHLRGRRLGHLVRLNRWHDRSHRRLRFHRFDRRRSGCRRLRHHRDGNTVFHRPASHRMAGDLRLRHGRRSFSRRQRD